MGTSGGRKLEQRDSDNSESLQNGEAGDVAREGGLSGQRDAGRSKQIGLDTPIVETKIQLAV